MKYILLLLLLILPLNSCIFLPSGEFNIHKGPYIDSIGYKAMEARVAMVAQETSSMLISEALAVQNDSLPDNEQATFFSSIEESYQRYLPLFKPVKGAEHPQVSCSYDLVETFNKLIVDTQPFMNAILHTMSLNEVTTIDFRVEPKNVDTTLLYVSLTKMESQENKKVVMSESDCILSLARHRATLMTALP